MLNFNNFKGYKTTICWKCANAYAHKCRRFHTDAPLDDIWLDYKTITMRIPKGSTTHYTKSYVVLSCKNFIKDERCYL